MQQLYSDTPSPNIWGVILCMSTEYVSWGYLLYRAFASDMFPGTKGEKAD